MNRFALLLLCMFYAGASVASEADVIVSAKTAVKNMAKDPDSVKFKDVFYSNTEAGGEVACGRFNAKNSYGAYAGYERFISNGKTTFVDGQKNTDPPFPELWIMLCHYNKR